MLYTISMKVEGRVDVTVETDSFDDAFAHACEQDFDPSEVDWIEYKPVNATDEKGNMQDY